MMEVILGVATLDLFKNRTGILNLYDSGLFGIENKIVFVEMFLILRSLLKIK